MRKAIVDPRLAVTIAGVTFRNPFFLASGPTTHSPDQLERGCELGWSGASIKLTFDPPPYINREPRYGYFEPQGFLSFTAEKRLALDQAVQLVQDSLPRVSKDFVIMANYSYTGEKGVEGWVNMAKVFEQAGCHVLELNMGCPNMSFNLALTGEAHEGGPMSGASLGMIPEAVAQIVRATVEAVSIPVFVKLSPEGAKLPVLCEGRLRRRRGGRRVERQPSRHPPRRYLEPQEVGVPPSRAGVAELHVRPLGEAAGPARCLRDQEAQRPAGASDRHRRRARPGRTRWRWRSTGPI